MLNEKIKKVLEMVKQQENLKAEYEKRLDLVSEIRTLKSRLQSTDYQAIKYAEGEMSAEEFAPIKAKRKAWRARINELEAELKE